LLPEAITYGKRETTPREEEKVKAVTTQGAQV
jgi:hypothetical protein